MIKESALNPDNAIERTVVPAGDYYMQVVKKGQTVRILDLEGNQAADTLFYNADDPAERYSAMDTIREQGNIYLTTGTRLLSNAGNVMLEIVADTCGRHDTIGGACATESNTVRYALDKKCMHACRDSWMLAVAEHEEFGIGKRVITHNINFFMNVPVTPEGKLTFEDGISDAGKYVELKDAYYSVREALHHAAMYHGRDINLSWVQSETLEECGDDPLLRTAQGIVVPGGFGVRGIEGMIKVANYARVNKIPYLGLCLGMQVMVIEFARHAFNSDKPNSAEFDASTPYPVIDYLNEASRFLPLYGEDRVTLVQRSYIVTVHSAI